MDIGAYEGRWAQAGFGVFAPAKLVAIEPASYEGRQPNGVYRPSSSTIFRISIMIRARGDLFGRKPYAFVHDCIAARRCGSFSSIPAHRRERGGGTGVRSDRRSYVFAHWGSFTLAR